MRKKIILLGDSITEAFPSGSVLKDYEIINKGISGDSTGGVYKRLSEDVVSLKPDFVFLLIGTNDFALGRNNDEIEAGIYKIVQSIKNSLHSAIIFSVSILPVRNLENRSNSRIIEVNRNIRKMAEELKINYFDLHSNFIEDKGMLRKKFTEDGLHLTSEAYRHWGELLAKLLSEIE